MEIEVCIDGIWYNLDKETQTAMVISSDNEEDKYQGEVVIPEVVVYEEEEYAVTHIEGLAFYGCSELTSITIPESVMYIGHGAFTRCSGLTSIVVAENNAIYDSRNNCNAIIEKKSNALIVGCSTTIIPESVTKIDGGAFSGCKGLTSITIPENVEEIGFLAFYGCTGLTSIIVAEKNAIYDSRNNCNAIIEKNTNTLIAGCSTTIIPENVTKIGSGAFGGCSGLTSFTIPKNVEEIEAWAFSGCSGLTTITIPENVTKIGGCICDSCSSLTSIIVAEKNARYDSRNNCNAIIETNTNTLIAGCSTTIIPECVTKIGTDAFEGCSGLSSIAIPKSVEEIECCAFGDCNSLTAITIPASVTKIGEEAFYSCNGLTSITIPESVTEMGSCAFGNCSNLKEVYCYNFSRDWNDAFDESLVGDITLHVPEHALDYVQKSFKKIVPIEAKVKE